MANEGLTNTEVMTLLELPEDTISILQTAQGSVFTAKNNEFLTALYNKITAQVVDSVKFTNPFKKYDGFPIKYGDTIENVWVELPKGYAFDKDATDPFTKVAPSVKALYASVNYEMQYQTTIQDSLIRRAVLSEYGLMNLITQIIGALNKSKSIDEYFATIAMLNNENLFAGGITEVERGADKEATAKKVTETIVNVVTDFALPQTTNNALEVLNATEKRDVLLIIKNELLNSINLDYLTGVYNLSKVDLVNNIIPVKSFQVKDDSGELRGEDIDFMIIDETGFDNHVALEDGGLIYNPKGKYTNHFYNLWKIIAYKYFYNAKAFKLVDAE